ncbi:hypothetical protein AB0J21_10075 [Streptomyces sp. NPDC049954]|uniref:hypothetical protein n=1 Tax=Streptomyces sp. NPDC049954 TaxID=3155779 RepID=UPI00341FF6F1
MGSEARAELGRLIREKGRDGYLRVGVEEGADLPPGSMEFPPCRCPRHVAEEAEDAGRPDPA